jgi:hypothetical protein
VAFGVVSPAKQEIDADVKEVGEADGRVKADGLFAVFYVTQRTFTHTDGLTNLLKGEIVSFP